MVGIAAGSGWAGGSRIGSLLTIADLIFSRRDGTRFNEGGIAVGHKTHACSKQVKQRPGNRPTDPGTGPGSGETRRTYWKKRAGTCPGQAGQISKCAIRYANWEILIEGCALDPLLAAGIPPTARRLFAAFVNPRRSSLTRFHVISIIKNTVHSETADKSRLTKNIAYFFSLLNV